MFFFVAQISVIIDGLPGVAAATAAAASVLGTFDGRGQNEYSTTKLSLMQ